MKHQWKYIAGTNKVPAAISSNVACRVHTAAGRKPWEIQSDTNKSILMK